MRSAINWKAGPLLVVASLLGSGPIVLGQEPAEPGPEAKVSARVRPGSGFSWIDGDDGVPAVVSRDAIRKGIPRPGHPLDVLVAIDRPEFHATPAEAEAHLGLRDEDRVIGVVIDGDARAYPTRILDRHEVANDTVAGRHLAVVW